MPDHIDQLASIIPSGVDQQFALHYTQLTSAVNSLLGYNGDVPIQGTLVLNGNRITGVGTPKQASDVVTHQAAEASYSADVLKPKFQSSGSHALGSYRMINSQNQREQVSSFLNDLMSTPPSANAIIPLTTPVMGGIQVTIPAGLFTFSDGSSVFLQSRTDILSLPVSYTISSISCVGNLVTVVTTTPIPITAGQGVTIAGVSPSGFNGSFTVTSFTGPSTFTYQDDLGTVSGSGGRVELNNVYYYSVTKRSNVVRLFGPFSGDTANNRLQVSNDGFQIVAVVVLTNSGSKVASTGGGGSAIVGSPTAGCFF